MFNTENLLSILQFHIQTQVFIAAIVIPQPPVSWLKETDINSKTTTLKIVIYSVIMKRAMLCTWLGSAFVEWVFAGLPRCVAATGISFFAVAQKLPCDVVQHIVANCSLCPISLHTRNRILLCFTIIKFCIRFWCSKLKIIISSILKNCHLTSLTLIIWFFKSCFLWLRVVFHLNILFCSWSYKLYSTHF